MSRYSRRIRRGIISGIILLAFSCGALAFYLGGYELQISKKNAGSSEHQTISAETKAQDDNDSDRKVTNTENNDYRIDEQWPADTIVKSNTVIVKEKVYLCGDSEIVEWIPADKDYIGMTFDELRLELEKESEQKWSHIAAMDNQIIIYLEVEDFCFEHKHWCHLGTYNNYLAVYQGPMGDNSRLLRVENIEVARLDSQLQNQLAQIMDYANQPADVKQSLKSNAVNKLEFASQDELNLVLQNFDEYSGA